MTIKKNLNENQKNYKIKKVKFFKWQKKIEI
jgi:hypothetical protein